MAVRYFIHGIFFSPGLGLRIGHDPEIGARAMVERSAEFTIYSGVIVFTRESEDTASGEGSLQDRYGFSSISDVIITPNELVFTKEYANRQDPIEYTFRKDGEFWIGSYSGALTGTGASRCTLQRISDEFFSPKGLEQFMKEAPELEF